MYEDPIGWFLLIGLVGIGVLFMYLTLKSVREIKDAFREYRTFETYKIQQLQKIYGDMI